MSNSVDTMKNFFNVLKLYANDTTTDGVAILDHAIRTTTRFAGLHDAVNNFISDMANVSATAGVTQSLLQNCGIVLGASKDFTADTGAVSGGNAGMGVVKNAQTLIPEPDVQLSQMPLPAEGAQVVHSCTGADGKTFYFTVTYPSSFVQVRDNETAPPDNDGDNIPEYEEAQSVYLQAGQTYRTQIGEDGYYETASGEQAAAAILTMIRGVENFWASEGFKLAYDSFGLDFNNKNLTLLFGINQGSQAQTGPAATDTAGQNYLPASNIEMEINSVMYAQIDPNDPNGRTRVNGGTGENYLDRIVAHEFIHAVMFASGTFKKDMPEFFTEGIAELVQGDDDYDANYTDTILNLAVDSDLLAEGMVFKAGTGSKYAYPAGEMFLRYLCKQSQPVSVQIGVNESDTFTHASSQDIISAYKESDKIVMPTGVNFVNANVAGNDVFITSNIGTVIVRDAADKVINFADANGTVMKRAALASGAGTIDGHNVAAKAIIYGADFADNALIAGDGGSQLWGGDYGTDTLVGGDGADIFVTGVLCGNDTIYNANAEDTIALSATSLEQIIGANVNANGVSLNFSDGSSLNVAGNVGAMFILANGSAYRANQSAGTFVNA